MEKNLYFSYLGLNERLYKFYQNGVRDLSISLLISLEKEYYEGENMKLIMKDLRSLMKGKKISLNYNGVNTEFKINKLNLFVGDTLNRHMFYYRYCEKYFKENNIKEEKLIPLEIRQQFEKTAYTAGTQEGKDWFRDNLEAIKLFSDEKIITKEFQIGDDITTIFNETDDTPQLDYICYNHWYSHPKYKEIEKSLLESFQLEKSIVDRCYNHEANYFYERLKKRGQAPEFEDLFVQQSKKYLIDETIPAVILNSTSKPNNYFDIYYYGKLPHHFEVYNGKEAKNNKMLQEYIQTKLVGIDDCGYISLREKE